MSMQWVRSVYSVPAKRGGRVRFDGQSGRIVSAVGGHLMLHLDGTPASERVRVHPTWRMEYLDAKS